MRGEAWVIVLAAGDGTRLGVVTAAACGICVPKQFVAFGAAQSQSLLRTTLDRARALVAPDHVVPVVAAEHECWWRKELDGVAPGNVVVQPRNAGTAPGVLLPLSHISAQDPDATVVVLPSDHHVRDESGFRAALGDLIRAAREDSSRVVLLGVEPESPETQYGWIVPSALSDGLTHDVVAFVEKPTAADAAQLLLRGGLWSTFIMAGSCAAFARLYELATPWLAWRFQVAATPDLQAVYETLGNVDFSRDVLQQPACRGRLRVLPAPRCGWSDLGTPERVSMAFGPRALDACHVPSAAAHPGIGPAPISWTR